jgi:hypothetical protein
LADRGDSVNESRSVCLVFMVAHGVR